MTERKKFKTATQVEPDHSIKHKKGTLWCSYCAEWKMFEPKKIIGGLSYPKCEGCGISNEDFWIKMSNKMWGIPKGTMRARK